MSSRFAGAASRPEQEPTATGPEVLFLGRSNVGKSSLVNRLLDAPGLARTSSRPGRTQSVNFYRVNDAFWFVDLPGYGFAAVPESVRRAWRPMVEGFLERHRDNVALGILLVDARRAPTELDAVMRDWLVARRIPHVVAATKADKLSGNGRARAEQELAAFAGTGTGTKAMLVSAETGAGIAELWRELGRALARHSPERGRRPSRRGGT